MAGMEDPMNANPTLHRFELQPHQSARLQPGRERTLRVRGGHVWLTVEGEREDRILVSGESIVLGADADVVVSAMGGPASMHASEAAAKGHVLPWWQRLLDGWLERPGRHVPYY
jgi:hypothetical protein